MFRIRSVLEILHERFKPVASTLKKIMFDTHHRHIPFCCLKRHRAHSHIKRFIIHTYTSKQIKNVTLEGKGFNGFYVLLHLLHGP